MKPGLYLNSVPCDIDGSPALAACDAFATFFANNADVACGVGIAITPESPRHLWVSIIRAFNPGRGLGGRAMDALCVACDRHGVVIELHALPVGEGGLDHTGLRSFYERCGFTFDDEHSRYSRRDAMVRHPRRMRQAA